MTFLHRRTAAIAAASLVLAAGAMPAIAQSTSTGQIVGNSPANAASAKSTGGTGNQTAPAVAKSVAAGGPAGSSNVIAIAAPVTAPTTAPTTAATAAPAVTTTAPPTSPTATPSPAPSSAASPAPVATTTDTPATAPSNTTLTSPTSVAPSGDQPAVSGATAATDTADTATTSPTTTTTLPTLPQPAGATLPGDGESKTATGELFRTVFSMLVVLGLLVGLVWMMRRLGVVKPVNRSVVKIVGGINVGNREKVVVIEIADQWVVLGVAPGRVNGITQMQRQEHLDLPADGTTASPKFADWLKQTISQRNDQRNAPHSNVRNEHNDSQAGNA